MSSYDSFPGFPDDLPRLARELAEAAHEAGGWSGHYEDDEPIEGATATFTLAFVLPLASGRGFTFMTRWARSLRTGRWQALKIKDGRYRVMGALLPGDGSTRDKTAELLGLPLEQRYWKAVKNCRYWLARPAELAALDWIMDAEAEEVARG